jgi:hypothetical protein
MTTIATLAVKVIADAAGFINAMDAAEKKTQTWSKNVSQNLKDVGRTMSDWGGKATTYLTAPIVAASVAAFHMAADMQDALGATDQIFGNSADTVKNWATSLESYYGIAQNEALQYSNMMGSMLQNIGNLSEDEAARQASTLIELAGDLTAMYGGTTADAVRALTGALKGNNTMLDNYGMVATDAMIKTKALEMGLMSEGSEMSAAAKQAATLALIMEQSSAAQGQAAREADGASGSLRAQITELKNLAITIGTMLMPYATQFLTWVREIIAWFQVLTPEQQKWLLILGAVLAVVGPLLLVVGSLVTAIGAIIPVITAVGSALLPLLPYILAVIAVLALLYAAWTQNWFGIQEKTRAALDYVRGLIAAGMQFIQDLTSGKLGWMSEMWQNAMDAIAMIIENGLAIWRHIKQAWMNLSRGNWYMFGKEMRLIWEAIFRILDIVFKTGWENLKLLANNALKGLVDHLKNIDWGELGLNILKGIGKGMLGGIPVLIDVVKQVGGALMEAWKGFFSIRSPSVKMEREIGWQLAAGQARGYERGVNALMPNVMVGPGAMNVPPMAAVGAVAGGGANQVIVQVDYRPWISTADRNEVKFQLGPMLEEWLRDYQKK